MKTAELEGALLDYWVARSMPTKNSTTIRESSWGVKGCYVLDPDTNEWKFFAPSRRWADGGPIIERERIAIVPTGNGWTGCYTNGSLSLDLDATATVQQDGPTPLIAAMRAYVALKFGEKVPE
jgi:hypothetical protein